MEYLPYIIPMVIAGVIYRIICAVTKRSSNRLFMVVIIAIGLAELFLVEESIGLGFAAAIVYNLFKVRTDPEVTEDM